MKLYYFFGAAVALVLAIIVFIISGISGCVDKNRVKKGLNEYEDWCNVRYFVDETEDSEVKYMLVDDGTYLSFSQDKLPSKEGYVFAGFYNNRDFTIGTMYVDSLGNGYIPITEDIVLYPIFTPIGG